MENLRLREAAPTSVNVTVGKRSREYLTDREVERLIEAAKQNRSGHFGTPRPSWSPTAIRSEGLGAGGTALGRHRPRHWALACTQGQARGCQRASDIGAGKPCAAQAPARSRNVPIRLHLGAPRAVVRSRISAHGCQGGRGCEIHVPRAFPHAAACLRVQARQRRPRHSRHPSLSRPPINHVHGPLHGLDAESVQKLLEGLTFQASRIKRRLRPTSDCR